MTFQIIYLLNKILISRFESFNFNFTFTFEFGELKLAVFVFILQNLVNAFGPCNFLRRPRALVLVGFGSQLIHELIVESLRLGQSGRDQILLQHPVDEVPDPGLVHLVTHHGREVEHQAPTEELFTQRQAEHVTGATLTRARSRRSLRDSRRILGNFRERLLQRNPRRG